MMFSKFTIGERYKVMRGNECMGVGDLQPSLWDEACYFIRGYFFDKDGKSARAAEYAHEYSLKEVKDDVQEDIPF